MTMETKPRGPRRAQPRLDSVLNIALASGWVMVVLFAGLVVYLLVRDFTAAWTGTGLSPFQPNAPQSTLPSGTQGAVGPLPTAIPLDQWKPPQPWSGKGRVTVLLMGLDYRDWERRTGPARSDTMMLVTLDPITNQAGMLSIPRDLYVEIPGFQFNRINAAYAFGEAYRLPGGGPGLAVQTVENLIGVPIQFYAVIDFSAFERMIDEIGGIDVLVEQRIKISPIGRLSFWLEAKPYHLDGAEALAYARVRMGAGDDFGRARRQQQVALAILDRIVGFDMIPTLFSKAPALYQELASGIRTNMTFEEMISLAWLALQTSKDQIRMGVIAPPGMVGFHTLPDGASVLRPVPDQIRQLRDQIFTETSAFSPQPPAAQADGSSP